MTVWIFAAFAAIGYITTLMNKVPLTNALTVKAPEKKPIIKKDSLEKKLAKIQSGVTLSNHQIKQLNIKHYALEQQISALKGSVAKFKNTTSTLNSKIESLEQNIEQNIGPITGALGRNEKNNTNIKTKSPAQDLVLKAPMVKPPLDQTTNFKLEKPEAKQQLAALNVPIPKLLSQQPEIEKKPTPQIIRTMFAVSLGNYPDLRRLKKAWGQLNKKYKSALGALKPRYVTLVVNNKPQYQLVTGPLLNALDAAKICYHLQQSKTYCKQTIFQGSDI